MPPRSGQEYLTGAGGYVMLPSIQDVDSPLAADIAHYYQGATLPARKRIQLFRLAWDIPGNAFGPRQLLYERYFSGDPVRLTAGRYVNDKTEPLMERVRELLGQAG